MRGRRFLCRDAGGCSWGRSLFGGNGLTVGDQPQCLKPKLGPPARCFLTPSCEGRVPLLDYRTKGTLDLTSLLEDLENMLGAVPASEAFQPQLLAAEACAAPFSASVPLLRFISCLGFVRGSKRQTVAILRGSLHVPEHLNPSMCNLGLDGACFVDPCLGDVESLDISTCPKSVSWIQAGCVQHSTEETEHQSSC